MNPFLHIIDRNKILFPPQLLAIKEVVTNCTEANGLCFAPLVMYSLGVNRLLKKVSSQKSFFPTPNSHRNAVPFSGNLGGGKRGRGSPAAACLLPRVQRLRRSVLGGASDPAAAAVQPPRVPHHPARPDNRLRFYYTLKVSCLGWVPKVCRASGRQPPACSAEPRAWLDPALASGPLSPQVFFGPQ